MAPNAIASRPALSDHASTQCVGDELSLLQRLLPIQRRLVHAGDAVCLAGERFEHLGVVHSGIFKSVTTTADGRERVAGVHFKGDWIGFDAIAAGRHTCDVLALDTGELWSVRYQAVVEAATASPELLAILHKAMCGQIERERDSMMALCTLPADARVADFLCQWTQSLAERGLRTDQINLRLTRAEIGNHLGLTLETVSRALSRMARADVIRFEHGRRELHVPEPGALNRYIETTLACAAS